MRIIYITTESYVNSPIIKSQVAVLIENLSVKGYDFHLITFEPITKNLIINKQYTHHQLRYVSHFFNMIYLIYYVLILANKGDIIHVRSYPPMFAGIFAKLIKKNKLIFDPRGLWPEEYDYKKNRSIISLLFKKFEFYFCRYSDKIVLVSNPFLKLFELRYSKFSSKMEVIPTFSIASESSNEVINLRKSHFRDEDILLIVYSGSLAEYQLIDDVLRYFKIISKSIKNSRFLFLSKSKIAFEVYLKSKLDPNRYVVIDSDYVDIINYLSQCDYGIIFRDQDLLNKVSSPIKVKDYLMSGLKIIATENIGDTSKLINENNCGFILENLSNEKMIDSIKHINKHAEFIFKNLDELSLNHIANAYDEIYKKI